MKKLILCASVCAALTGCAYNLTLMPRDSGKTYSGTLESNGTGGGTMQLQLDNDTCSGPVARVASNESFGFANTYGFNNRGTTANSFTTGYKSGDVSVKALLTCSSGHGIRCDLTGRGTSGGGICVDDAGHVFDVLATTR